MSETRADRCGNCVYSLPNPDNPEAPAECRRYPPVIFPSVGMQEQVGTTMQNGVVMPAKREALGTQAQIMYPKVRADMWCGEHQKREEGFVKKVQGELG